MKALILSANDFEDSELLVPKYRLEEAGYTVEVASGHKDPIRGMHGYDVNVDKSFAEVVPSDYALLILPGGKAPAAIRKDPTVISIVQQFFAAQKPVGAICHGPQTLVTAGLLRNRRATCYHTVAKELQDAGSLYEHLVTSRQPADLPAFMRELIKLLTLKNVCVSDKYWGEDAPIPFEAPLKKLK